MMYNDYGQPNHTYHAQRAYEIELRVREMEKKNALMNYTLRSRGSSGNGFLTGLKKTAHRLSSLVSALFVG